MENEAKLILSQDDFDKVSSLLFDANTEAAELLGEELNRAHIVPVEQLPKDVVAMNSKVAFVDNKTSKESIVTLVYPHEANIEDHKISVLSPVGSALIGLRVGQSIKWPMPNGSQKILTVSSVNA